MNPSSSAIRVRPVRSGALVDAYPAGTFDVEVTVDGAASSAELAAVAGDALQAEPRCRRAVIGVPERDVAAIAWAEAAGFRYVVDVETRGGSFSLLVLEPEWVLRQPHVLEDIPLEEGR